MKIAYLILAHKNPKQVKRLLNNLDDDVYVHLDLKCSIDKFKIEKNNVYFIRDRVNINWGGFSMIQATLNLIESAINNKQYDYYILLSGDDYPIKPLEEFKKFLMNNRTYSFLEYESFDEHWPKAKFRYNRYKISESNKIYIKFIQKILNLIVNKRNMYKNMIAFKGSQWWCLNLESIEYIIDYIKNNNGVLKYFMHTHIPDEMFFQTILLNSSLKDKIINDNLRYIILEESHPETLTIEHYSVIRNLKNKFFARKFDINIDSNILDILDNI